MIPGAQSVFGGGCGVGISRTLELPRDLNFGQLHEVLQAAIGWTDSHLHQFIVGGLVVGAPEYLEEDAYGLRVIEATEVRLRDLRFPYRHCARLARPCCFPN
jgi:hypothetical protein